MVNHAVVRPVVLVQSYRANVLVRVWHELLARAFGKEKQNPYTIGALKTRGPLAQLVEQRTFNPWVVGSIPTGPTNAQVRGYKRRLSL